MEFVVSSLSGDFQFLEKLKNKETGEGLGESLRFLSALRLMLMGDHHFKNFNTHIYIYIFDCSKEGFSKIRAHNPK